MTIQGVVATTIRETKAVIESITFHQNRPMKMSTAEIEPIIRVATARDNLGNTLEKSRPVPYSDVVPVDMPLNKARAKRGMKKRAGVIASSPPA